MIDKYYKVDLPDNFYDCMVGKLIFEAPRVIVLEFQLIEDLGGVQKVSFYKNQISLEYIQDISKE